MRAKKLLEKGVTQQQARSTWQERCTGGKQWFSSNASQCDRTLKGHSFNKILIPMFVHLRLIWRESSNLAALNSLLVYYVNYLEKLCLSLIAKFHHLWLKMLHLTRFYSILSLAWRPAETFQRQKGVFHFESWMYYFLFSPILRQLLSKNCFWEASKWINEHRLERPWSALAAASHP